jgi:hypothetical protein
MIATTLTEFFERLLSVERTAADLFRRLAARLERHPSLAAQVRGIEADKREQLDLIVRFRDSLPPEVLARTCEADAVRQLERVSALLEEDPVPRFDDLDDAYEFIHEFEVHELAPLLRLLDRECRTERIDCSSLMLIVEQHLARLDAVVAAAGDRLQRRAIRL